MADTLLTRSAIAGAQDKMVAAGLQLRVLSEGHMLHVMARSGRDLASDRLAALGDGDPHAIRLLGPSQWLVVGNRVLSPDDIRAKAAELGDLASLFDGSHGRVRMVLAGTGAADRLATGSGVDLRSEAFPIGRSAATLFRHIAVHITRVADETFEILVARSFAQSLWDELGGGPA
jgi:sarcosine oxidase subunit gamma